MGAITIAVASEKGGVGKSTLAGHVATLAAEGGYFVLLVDADTGTNVGPDLGLPREADDRGAGLREALATLTVPAVVTDLRPNLDIIPGGGALKHLDALAPTWRGLGIHEYEALRLVLQPMHNSYDLIVIDTGPGDSILQPLAFGAADFVVIPTRHDPSSIRGVVETATSFEAVREFNPGLELLGVVLCGLDPQERSVANREARATLTAGLGDVTTVFEQGIRYQAAGIVQAAKRGMTLVEYERKHVRNAPRFWEDGGREPVARRAGTLSSEFQLLTAEILSRAASRRAERNFGVSA